jgi:hypothetical protein
MSGFTFSSDQSDMSLLITTKYIPRAVVRLVNKFIAYDWIVKDE